MINGKTNTEFIIKTDESNSASSPPKFDSNNNNNNNVSKSNNNTRTSNTGNKTSNSSKISEKYGLRPRTIIKRIQLERTRDEAPVKQSSRKPKAPPLSKYRRKTANARERHRMKEINEAFATLRGILPSYTPRRPSPSNMTKITTLRMAASYIQALSDVLNDVTPSECRSIHTTHSITTSCSSLPETQKSCDDVTEFHGSRSSLSSNSSDLGDLFSDDSCVFDENMSAFDDIPSLQEPDPFGLLLVGDQVDIMLES